MESPSTEAPRFSTIGFAAARRLASLRAPPQNTALPPLTLQPGWSAKLVDRFGNVWLQAPDAVEVPGPRHRAVLDPRFRWAPGSMCCSEDAEETSVSGP